MKCGRKREYLPDDETIRRLLFDEKWSGMDIIKHYGGDVSSGFKILRRMGITEKTQRSCNIKGCHFPPKKIWSAPVHAWYGRLCEDHRKEHYRNLGREYQRKKKKIAPPQYKPWERKDKNQLTEYERETICLIQAKKQRLEVVRFLRQRREASR